MLLLFFAATLGAPSARADGWTLEVAADAGPRWLDHPPGLSQFSGVTLLPITTATDTAYFADVSARAHAALGVLELQLGSLELGVGADGYSAGAGAGVLQQDGPLWLLTLGLPGAGMGVRTAGLRMTATVYAAVDYLDVAGHFTQQNANVTATGQGLSFSVRARFEFCLRGDPGDPWICAVGGPTLVQSDHWLDGAYLGLGVVR
jgi:hypothetical protein